MKPDLAQGVPAAAHAPAGAGRTKLSRRISLSGRSPSSYLYLASLSIATAYLVVFVAQLQRIVESFAWDSDVATGFTLPSTLVKTGSGGHTLLSTTGEYLSLWFGLLTASLPLHHALWEIAPIVLFLAAALAIGWSVSKVATRGAAILAVALALVVSPEAIFVFTTAYSHNIAYLDTCLLGAYVVWLMRAQPRRRATRLAVPLLAGIALGLGLASDLLLLVCGIVPFVVTAAFGFLQRDRRSRIFAVSALATVAAALPTALITSKIMGSFGFVILRPVTSTTPLSALPLHSEYLYSGLKLLFGGNLADQQAASALQTVVGVASEAAMIAALLALLVLGAHTTFKILRSIGRRAGAPAQGDPARQLHVIYWTGSAVSTVVAYEFSAVAFEVHAEYYATLIFAVAAIAPLLLTRGSLAGWLVPVGASSFFAASLVGLTGTSYAPSPLAKDEPTIVRLAAANHATTGYAGYWYASDLTWNAHERVQARPVWLCENPAGADICPFYLGRVPSWYAPTQRRSFLLVNPAEKYLPGIPPGLGNPIAAYELAGSTRMYIYPYDIASRLGPAPD